MAREKMLWDVRTEQFYDIDLTNDTVSIHSRKHGNTSCHFVKDCWWEVVGGNGFCGVDIHIIPTRKDIEWVFSGSIDDCSWLRKRGIREGREDLDKVAEELYFW